MNVSGGIWGWEEWLKHLAYRRRKMSEFLLLGFSPERVIWRVGKYKIKQPCARCAWLLLGHLQLAFVPYAIFTFSWLGCQRQKSQCNSFCIILVNLIKKKKKNRYSARLESEHNTSDAEISTSMTALGHLKATNSLRKQVMKWFYNPESLVYLLTLVISEATFYVFIFFLNLFHFISPLYMVINATTPNKNLAN